jgi:Tfp pilus assembly protein PilO
MSAMRLTKEHQQLAGLFALVAGIGWVYYAVVFMPLFRGVAQAARETAATGKQLHQIRELLAQEPQLRQEQAQLTQALDALRPALPKEEDLPSTLQALSEAASQSGVRIQTIVPQRSVETFGPAAAPAAKKTRAPAASPSPPLYRQIPIQIDAAAGFHQLGAFVTRMESGPQALRVTTLRVTSEKAKEFRRHQITLTVLGSFSAEGS